MGATRSRRGDETLLTHRGRDSTASAPTRIGQLRHILDRSTTGPARPSVDRRKLPLGPVRNAIRSTVRILRSADAADGKSMLAMAGSNSINTIRQSVSVSEVGIGRESRERGTFGVTRQAVAVIGHDEQHTPFRRKVEPRDERADLFRMPLASFDQQAATFKTMNAEPQNEPPRPIRRANSGAETFSSPTHRAIAAARASAVCVPEPKPACGGILCERRIRQAGGRRSTGHRRRYSSRQAVSRAAISGSAKHSSRSLASTESTPPGESTINPTPPKLRPLAACTASNPKCSLRRFGR